MHIYTIIIIIIIIIFWVCPQSHATTEKSYKNPSVGMARSEIQKYIINTVKSVQVWGEPFTAFPR